MKIKIRVGTYLNSDAQCYWISKERENKKTGKTEERRFTGYFGRIDQLLDDYFEQHIRDSKSSSLTALRKDVAAIKKEIREIAEEIKRCLTPEE